MACTRRDTSLVQLRKKHGCNKGTGLGIATQGLRAVTNTQWRKKTEKPQATTPQNREQVSNVMGESSGSSNSLAAINSSNMGFQLLKKHGWKEGIGASTTEPKHNKQGQGSNRKAAQPRDTDSEEVSKKSKKLSKKLPKMIEHEKFLAEKEFERAFRREFWPDNV